MQLKYTWGDSSAEIIFSIDQKMIAAGWQSFGIDWHVFCELTLSKLTSSTCSTHRPSLVRTIMSSKVSHSASFTKQSSLKLIYNSFCKFPGRRRHRHRHRHRHHLLPFMMMGLLLMGSILVPMGFQFLAVLGGKALILAKMALILSSIQGLKKIATSGINYGLYHVHDRSHQVLPEEENQFFVPPHP